MFLKRIEMQGFKSFADKTIINFNDSIVGIVGPNGCGKSNISDAVRWVLGEQSAKSLRGTQMSDVIFSGTEKRKGVNFAEVKLVFDNTNRIFDIPYNEVELTRKISRLTNENEYYINKELCRLKDINDLILDTGIGRDSLSIISQGNVSSLADARPIDRRTFFEEAAGVAKYKKRKIETLNKLARTKDSLDQTKLIIDELNKQYTPLQRQAKKAEIYLEKKNELQEIEVSVLVNEITEINKDIAKNKEEIFKFESNCAAKEAQINVHDNFCLNEKVNLRAIDRAIQNNSEELLAITKNIQVHENKKNEFEQRRNDIANSSEDIISYQRLQLAFEETKIELADRNKRLEQLNVQEKLNQESIHQIKAKLSDIELNFQQKQELLRKYENQLSYLTKTKANPFAQYSGVKSIVDNKSLAGIKGVMADLIKPQEGYEQAVEVALGGALYNVVTTSQDSARSAVNYLKLNSGGRVTFLPLDVLTPRIISEETETIAESNSGYLGVVSDYVDTESNLTILKESLLANILIVDNLKNANEIARMIKFNNKVVTLDGDVVHRGGAITGGKNKDETSILTLERQIESNTSKIAILKQEVSDLLLSVNDLRNKQSKFEEEVLEAKLNIAQIMPVIEAKTAKLTKLKYDLETNKANKEAISLAEADLQIIEKLNDFYAKRDELTNRLSKDRSSHLSLSKEIENREQQMRLLRKSLSEETSFLNAARIKLATNETEIKSLLYRLNNDYQLSYETALLSAVSVNQEAKERALLLRSQIQALGNVNLDAPSQFVEVSERFEFLSHQYDQLIQSSNMLLSAIEEMDDVMSEQFLSMFNQINEALPEVFTHLFGGGRAKLVLDSDNILECGIDIDVQPPGKSVKNIRLFSGGEKCLIAISVLFAILKVRPVPLCILDEAEAALDPANVERFAKYIKSFSDDTQFIVITHRPGTMDKCDTLFGITMTNNGISELLRIQLTQALDYIEK